MVDIRPSVVKKRIRVWISNDDSRPNHSVTVIGLKWRFWVDGKSSVMEW
jgi:hypothetical protein